MKGKKTILSTLILGSLSFSGCEAILPSPHNSYPGKIEYVPVSSKQRIFDVYAKFREQEDKDSEEYYKEVERLQKLRAESLRFTKRR